MGRTSVSTSDFPWDFNTLEPGRRAQASALEETICTESKLQTWTVGDGQQTRSATDRVTRRASYYREKYRRLRFPKNREVDLIVYTAPKRLPRAPSSKNMYFSILAMS
jgi:hypothetical protein